MIRVVRSRQAPELGRGVFLAETCAVIGDVVIGEESSIWYGTVVRGDVMPIRIGARTIDAGQHRRSRHRADVSGTTIGSDCTIGHAAIIHACTVEDFCLIGMGSIILDGCADRSRQPRGCRCARDTRHRSSHRQPRDRIAREGEAAGQRKEREQIDYGATHYVELARRYLAEAGESSLP